MKVLVPIDGSSCSINTLDWIADNLDKSKTQYTLLLVIPKSFSELEDEETDQIDETVRLLKEGRWYLERKGCLVERAEYVLGDPVEAICRYADEMRVDEIVIGSHGFSGGKHALLGSVSSGVFEQCGKPVFVYRNRNSFHMMLTSEDRPPIP